MYRLYMPYDMVRLLSQKNISKNSSDPVTPKPALPNTSENKENDKPLFITQPIKCIDLFSIVD